MSYESEFGSFFVILSVMKRFLEVLRCLLSIHLLGLAVTSILRLALFIVSHSMLSVESANQTFLPLGAFIRGIWLDNVVGCYILILPLAVCWFACLIGYCGKWVLRPMVIWMQVLWSVVILISTANIPYFQYFFKNINSSIWNWAEYGTQTLGMLFGESSYYPPLIALILLIVLFVIVTNKLFKKFCKENRFSDKRWATAVIGVVCVGLCIFGIRGRTGYNPIKVSAAYYCEDAFLNQLGVSPTFNLLTSTLDDFRPENKVLKIMDGDEALKNVAEYYNWETADNAQTVNDSLFNKKNVVLILMESMSANQMSFFGNKKNLTPFLDSLASKSIFFTNFYSSGIHTNHGMFATLYSFPAILERNMMKGTNIPLYEGLPTVLKENGYRTMFFMTHESQYDNMNAFFRTNGYEEIYSQENYPSDKVVNSFGVQDDFLFDYAIDKISNPDSKEDATKPFFATLLSISNHPPYVIPKYFQPKSSEIEQQIVEYADWSLRKFFDEAKKQSWYKNTIFVLLGDHGALIGEAENEMPQSYNHIPLIIFTPDSVPSICDGWGIQMDVQPTLLTMLGIHSDIQNFGIDLLNGKRPYAFYCADDIMGVRSEKHLLVYRPSDKLEAKYLEGKRTETEDSVFTDMKKYLFNNLQAAEILTKKH